MYQLPTFLHIPSVTNLKKNLKNIFKNIFCFGIGLQGVGKMLIFNMSKLHQNLSKAYGYQHICFIPLK